MARFNGLLRAFYLREFGMMRDAGAVVSIQTKEPISLSSD
ncbi:hypothetical protein STRDD12_01039 [Streptococcus sp. DD12]|nr:hypothetical protein STRDD12_01039 [Streptococcus sp. DD12]